MQGVAAFQWVRGLSEQHTATYGVRPGQLGWMLFLKILDEREDYRSPIPQELRSRAWAADPEGITGDELTDFVTTTLFPTLKELPADPARDPLGVIVRRVFEDAYHYMKSGTLFRQVINRINEIDFTASEDRHLFNDIYEKILKDLQSAGNSGEYYTPRRYRRDRYRGQGNPEWTLKPGIERGRDPENARRVDAALPLREQRIITECRKRLADEGISRTSLFLVE